MKNNNKVKAIIIDDESYWQVIIKKYAEKITDISVEGVFSDIQMAYEFLADHEIELIFLDIEVKTDNGIELIKRLQKKYTVIIISAHSSYALEGYRISAIDYLTKPIDFNLFENAVQKAIQNITMRRSLSNAHKITAFDRDYFLIREDQCMLKVLYNDVIYVTALENYIKIITQAKTHIILTTLSQFERSINNHPFVRIHRSYIINVNAIKSLHKDTCTLLNNQDIPIGDMYKSSIQEIFVEGKLIKR